MVNGIWQSRVGLRLGSWLVAVVLLALPLSSAQGRVIDQIVAEVNEETILLSEIDKICGYALSQIPSTLPLEEAQERRRKIRLETLDTLIDERLMSQQIKEKKIVVSDEEIDTWLVKFRKDNNLTEEQFILALRQEGKTIAQYKAMLRSTFERQRLLGAEMRGKMIVSEQDVSQYYQEHYVRGSGSEKVKASHVLFSIPPGSPAEQEAAILERAKKVLAALQAGSDFGEVAKKESDDPSSSLGGDLGWFRRGDMVAAFEKAAFGQKKGEMSGLVRTRFGYHIILVTDRSVEEPPTLDQVEKEIRRRLNRDVEKRLIRSWLDDLKRNAYINIKL